MSQLVLPLIYAYIDIKAAFDSVDRLALWKALHATGAPQFLIQLIQDLHTVRNFPSAAVAAVSAATFGERPRQAADAAHLLLLAGSQRRCSVDRAGALRVCLRSIEIFDWKD